MPKVTTSNWTESPGADDYRTAGRYLGLLLPDETARMAAERLRYAPLTVRRADDLLRAGGLGPVPAEDPAVARLLKGLKKHRLLSPVLCLRGDLHRGAPLTIADGYHRICASYLLNPRADIPCRLAELPRPGDSLADAVGPATQGG